jgi:hypothetical protein
MLVDSHSLHTPKTTPTNKSTYTNVHALFCGNGQNQVRGALKYLRPRLIEASNLNHTVSGISHIHCAFGERRLGLKIRLYLSLVPELKQLT